MPDANSLPFQVAPHMLEDFGLNLYSDLSRAIVEFVANAHDADADWAEISFDEDEIKQQRNAIKSKYVYDKAKFDKNELDSAPEPLGSRTLANHVTITVLDNGIGMSEEDLKTKFLVAGRKRREIEAKNGVARTPSGRLLMGRKGLGKLAGFGIAKRLDVISKREDESYATKITLDFDDIRKFSSLAEVLIPKERLDDGGGIETKGTKIILSRLLHEPCKNKESTVKRSLSEHFELIRPEEFEVRLNGEAVPPPKYQYAFCYPDNGVLPPDQMKLESLETPEGKINFNYRIRFKGSGEALPASKRGIRVYAHRRLAAAPSLLDTNPNVHGFRQADYLDGVVEADFIDDQPSDYIATDRQTLRWETPLLSPLYDFLGEQMGKAVTAYQKFRDEQTPDKVKSDEWTMDQIEQLSLNRRDEKLAIGVATILARSFNKETEDPMYRERLVPLIKSVGRGAIVQEIIRLGDESNPTLQQAAIEITRLSKDEIESSIDYVRARVKGIGALKKIVNDQNFKDSQNEKDLQKLFEQNPWLIDSSLSQVMTGDTRFVTVLDRLAKALSIANHASPAETEKEKRPDLVFLIGNSAVGKVFIVELKSANTPLVQDHLTQLHRYVATSEKWLEEHDNARIKVYGQLIGTMAKPESNAQGVVDLRISMKRRGPNENWTVRDYGEVLSDAEAAHVEMLDVYKAQRELDEKFD